MNKFITFFAQLIYVSLRVFVYFIEYTLIFYVTWGILYLFGILAFPEVFTSMGISLSYMFLLVCKVMKP